MTITFKGFGMLAYENKKGKKVFVKITKHAENKFVERYNKVNGHIIDLKETYDLMQSFFSNSNKVKNLNRFEKKRLLKYGKDTQFFRTNFFTFIIKNATLITVEISDKGKRYLN